jgi:hypothetical protein
LGTLKNRVKYRVRVLGQTQGKFSGSDLGYGFKVRIQGSDLGYGFKVRIQG